MSNLIVTPNDGRDGCRTHDSVKYEKNCGDFVCLEDGTITKECRYCNWSLQCRQIDIGADGKPIQMESNYLPVYDAGGNLQSHELFCTGVYDLRPHEERLEDDKVS